MTRRDVAAACALAVCVGAFFAPALFGDRAIFTWNMDLWLPWAAHASPEDLARPTRLADCARQFAVMRGLADDALRAGRIPLWNPWILSGTPFLANFQPGVFYPPNLLLAFSGLTLPAQMTAYLAFHLLLGVAGVYALLRSYRTGTAAAMAGAIVFGWSGYNAARTGIPTMVATGAWLPWALAASRRWFDRADARAFAGMAGSLAMAGLAGFAQIFVFTAYAWGLCGLIDGAAARTRRSARRWIGWAAAGVLGVALVSVHLVPTLELTGLAQDAESPPGTLASGTVHPWMLAKLVTPWLFGDPAAGTNATHLFRVGSGYYFQTERSTAVYVGVLPLLLAGLVLLGPGDHRRETFAALVLAGAGLLLCFAPPFVAIASRLPGLAFSRPDRATFLWCTGMALLTGIGVERLASREGPGLGRPANRLALTIGAACVLAAAALAVAAPSLLPQRVTEHLGAGVLRRAALGGLLVAAIVAGLVLARTGGRLGRRAFLALALVVLGADLGAYAGRRNVMQPAASVFRPPSPGGSLEFLQRARAAEGPFRVLAFEPVRHPLAGVLPPSTAALYGIEDVLGFDSINLARTRELLEAVDPEIVVKRGNFRGVTRPEALVAPIVDLLNARYVLSVPGLRLPGMERVHDSDLAVHRNPDALPRAFLVDEIRVAGPAEILRAMARPDFRPDLWAWSEVPIEGVGPPPAGERTPAGSARTAAGEERVEVEVSAARPALLVLAEAWYPGWKAFVDGAERPIYRVDHALRGVVVRPGDRRVVFEYHPASFRIGAGLSLAALAALLLGTAAVARTAGRSGASGRTTEIA
jgi:hypothetical protein